MSLQIILFVVLIVGPIFLAWFKGDTLLNHLDARRRAQQQQKRQRSTRALPVRETVMDTLLQVETRRNDIEGRIGVALSHFRQVTENGRALTANKAAAVILDELERVVLSRESMFNEYLDTACLQSDTIEVMTQEVALLREATAVDHSATPAPTGAAMHLLETLRQAEQKRVKIDQRLNRLGRA
jgi:hypothetical protein